MNNQEENLKLPLLPGNSFPDITQNHFELSHHFDVIQGHNQMSPLWAKSGVGNKPYDVDSVAYQLPSCTFRFDPTLTYGKEKKVIVAPFRPHFSFYDGKILSFKGFFKQPVYQSPNEHYRVRHVNILYYLSDDTIQIMEPRVENSGIDQGCLLRRGKIPKNDLGEYWHWKDMNIGRDYAFYALVYHTVDCDNFSKEFFKSQGIILNEPEQLPPDPYTLDRNLRTKTSATKTKLVDDKLRRFLEFDKRILRFDAAWDDRDSEDGELLPHTIFYFLVDDTIEVKEILSRNCGKDPFPCMIKRMKMPKSLKDVPVTFPSIYLETSEEDFSEFYSPKDLLVGNTVCLLGRRFFIYDCDSFTRNYYKNVLNIEQGERIETFPPKKPPEPVEYPPHTTFGTPEDSLQSCLSVDPKPPKSDVAKYIINAGKKLTYEIALEYIHPEDEIRKFVLIYSLADSKIKIVERVIRNSGFIGGVFLKPTMVPKPGSDPSYPTYYTPADFGIGSVISVFSHRFIITDIDEFVYRYITNNREKFPPEVIESVQNHLVSKGKLKGDIDDRLYERLQEEHHKEIEEECGGAYRHGEEDENTQNIGN